MDSWARAFPFASRFAVGTPAWRRTLGVALGLLAALPGMAWADAAALRQQVHAFALAATGSAAARRIEVQVGELDPRLHLAPCDEVQPYLPPAARLWGRTRIGMRCLRGPSRWNVFLPVTVKVFGPALVATRSLPAGSTLAAGDLAQAEVDLAEEASNALLQPEQAIGRTLARPVEPGRGLRLAHLQPRQWFAAGETVQLVAQGSGFRVSGEGRALTAGTEGQAARVRTESGRVLSGQPAGERRVEVKL